MQTEIATIKIETKLILSQRELNLLINLLSYDIREYVKTITPNSYEGGVSTEEMSNFVGVLLANASRANSQLQAKLKSMTDS